jgi:nitrite reductase/ring-hydroxylating ferredoxin subunit
VTRRLFESSALLPRASLRFELQQGSARGHSALGSGPAEGFALRAADGSLRAYANECPHRGQPVDVGDGKLFQADGSIECQAHGAFFDPASGACVRGPCVGAALRALEVSERDGAVWLAERVEEEFDEGSGL